jgi:hypothetical protein
VGSPETNTLWVKGGYSVSTHPDLCELLRELAGAAELRFEFGRPVVVAPNGVIVALAAGTHILCVRLPRAAVDPRLVVDDRPDLGPEWTRVDPWTTDVPRAEGLAALATLVRRAVENASDGDPAPRD